MFGAVARKFFGSANDRRIRSYQPRVDEINALEHEIAKLSDEALRARTDEFKRERAEGKTLDDLLVPAFATVREAAKRTLGQRHFDVQLIGGMILHEGRISEMKTGEGKTLVATLPVYLNALAGRGVHVVTVNDSLAKRDAEWMGQIYNFLGLTVGVIVHGLEDNERKAAYACDVTYGTNNELGFDYLRDNMKYRLEDMVQRGHVYAIVDEVDSILIDEARTPLIISGPLDDRSDFYNTIDTFIPNLDKSDYEVDEKQRTVNLTEAGMEKMESRLRDANLLKSDSLYDIENVSVVHHRDVLDVVERIRLQEIRVAQPALHLLHAGFGEVDGALLLVDLVIGLVEVGDEGVDGVVEIRAVVERAGDDQRRARFVDQDRVDLVDDRIDMAALHHVFETVLHVVAQIVEHELVVGAVGHGAGGRRLALGVVEPVHDHADREPEEIVDLPHPLGVAFGEVVVHRHHVHAAPGQRVEIDRKRRDQRLAFAGLHLGDLAFVQDHAADQLHVEMALP